ncbi:hypothetical protein ONZ51_g3454 [Trametes cubensis]|uniref:Uncharacterized protein n=1 Tax=Trametes cubensis TaxID=1111947 RepID=A0AAD7TYS7_9APHY|nr:hypothetical protein ONZ51_g3454 [Trametes cubensis]
MASIFRFVFGCCLRRQRVSDLEEPNENTPFIAPTDDIPPPRNYTTIDHEVMKERLGTIVRSKEGKMVNVNQPLPFNLHGRPPHGRPDRSLSANTTPPRASSSAAQSDSALPESSHAPRNPHNHRLPSYSPSRDPSPSIQTSHSTSSLHPGDASYLPPEADPDGGTRGPILNVRLVRATRRRSSGGRPHQGLIISRGRQGRSGEERERENGAEVPGAQSPANIDAKGKGKEGENTAIAADSSPTRVGGVGAMSHNGNDTDGEGSGSVPSSQPELSAMDSEFKIDDIGNIAESWGD